MEVFKDIFETMRERVRSPFWGALTIAFLVTNWKPIWYLLFADQSALTKFAFFDGNTDPLRVIYLPFAFAVGVVFFSPILRLLGVWWASWFAFEIKKIERKSTFDLKIFDAQKQAELDEALERAEAARAERLAKQERDVIEAAKRKKEAEELGDDTLADFEEVRNDILSVEEAFGALRNDKLAQDFLTIAAESEDGSFSLNELRVVHSLPSMGSTTAFKLNNHRERLEADSLLAKMCEFGLLMETNSGTFKISMKGYAALDELRVN